MHRALLIPVGLLVSPTLATAQFCFRGRPAPHCESFLITEFALAHRFHTRWSESPWVLQWELGALVNRGDHSALGGSVTVGGTDPLRFGVKARARYWLGSKAALDIAPGVLLHTSGAGGLGFTGHVAVSYGDWFGAGLQVETLPASRPLGPPKTLIGPRVQVASYAAGIVGAVVALIGALMVASATST
jgi:hypothetical protein